MTADDPPIASAAAAPDTIDASPTPTDRAARRDALAALAREIGKEVFY